MLQVFPEGEIRSEGEGLGLQVRNGEQQSRLDPDVLHLRVVIRVQRPEPP